MKIKLTNEKRFRDTIRSFQETVKDLPNESVQKLMLDIQTRTVLKTPVDTGRLVGGWQISIAKSAPNFKYNKYSKDKKSRKNQESKIKQNQIKVNTKKIEKYNGGILWFANNVEYVKYREFGTNRTSGKFMLTKAIQQVKMRADEILKQGKNI